MTLQPPTTVDEQFAMAEAFVADANEALEQERVDAAKQLFEQGLELLDALMPTHPAEELKRMAAQSSIQEALGVIDVGCDAFGDAEHHYQLALQLRQSMAENNAQDMGYEVALPRAVTHLNLAGLFGTLQRYEEAHEHGIRAVELTTEAVEAQPDDGDDPQLDLLMLSCLGAVGSINATAGDLEAAKEAFEQGVLWARAVLTRGLDDSDDEEQESSVEQSPEFLGRYAQMLVHTAMIHGADDAHQEAFDFASEATMLGQLLLEVTEQEEALELYLNAQLLVMQNARNLGRFADAEDALFKTLALAPGQPELVAMGEQFYEALLERSDEELEAGGLPRDEVLESLGELRESGGA